MAKAQKKKKPGTKAHKLYDVKSGLKRKNKSCPKCGKGVFMAQHKDRATCGKCGWTEFSKSN
jgi:small subunit ribosomal protein S27Ae